MRNLVSIVVLILASLLATSAFARSFRVVQTPGGPDFDCELCHLSTGGLNDFGFDAFEFLDSPDGDLDWSQLAPLDSDNDGYTNGFELGDPNGTWQTGQPYPSGTQTHPADKTENACGNGTLDGPEECDGTNVNGFSCTSLAQGDGVLGCTETCVFDTSQCGECGDGQIQSDREECDGSNLGEATCGALGFEEGTLSCDASCQLITSACMGSSMGGTDPPGAAAPMNCGDGVRDADESCDGEDLGAASCVSLGFGEGVLSCNAGCRYDTSACGSGAEQQTGADRADAGTGPESAPSGDGSSVDIHMTGRACAVSGWGREAAPLPLLLLVGVLVWLRRRR